MLAHIPEFKSRNNLGSVAGKHPARRRDVERTAAPAANARFGKSRIVIRNHRINDDLAMVLRPQHLDLAYGFFDLLARGHERGAVLQGPAVILDVSDFHAARAER